MKKFNVKENMAVALSEGFKKSIKFAVDNTRKAANFPTDRFNKRFVGSLVTFNPKNSKVELFEVYDFVEVSDDQQVNISVTNKMLSFSENEEYRENEFVCFLNSKDFDVQNYFGYPSAEEVKQNELKMENKYLNLYIDVISGNIK